MNQANTYVELGVTKEEFREHLERQIEGMREEFTRYCKTVKKMEKYKEEDQEELDVARVMQRALFYGFVTNQVTLHNIDVAWSHVERHAASELS